MFILHDSAYNFCLWHYTMHRKCFHSLSFFISSPFSSLTSTSTLNWYLELTLIGAGSKLRQKSPLTLLVIGQHADDGPLCENDCISNAQQVIIAMEIQWCWTQGLADLS